MTTTVTDRSLNLKPVAGLIGAEVLGWDLRLPLSEREADAIRLAVAENGVIFFREQDLSVDEHVRVARALGELRDKTIAREKAGPDAVGVISTENKIAYAAALWHSDSTNEVNPPSYCVLHMELMPDVGGDTMWSSQAAAYDGLSPRVKTLIDGLTATHAYGTRHYQLNPGLVSVQTDHPLVCVNPLTKRKALFVNRAFTQSINGLSDIESTAILDLLFEHSVRPEYTCRWRWSPKDIAIWNNPYVQHFAIHDYGQAARKIHRVEIAGEPMVAATS